MAIKLAHKPQKVWFQAAFRYPTKNEILPEIVEIQQSNPLSFGRGKNRGALKVLPSP